MSNWGEASLIGLVGLSLLQLDSNEMSQKSLGLDLRELNSSRGISLEDQLLLSELGKVVENCSRPGGNGLSHKLLVSPQFLGSHTLLLGSLERVEIRVQLINQELEIRDVMRETLRDNNGSEIFSL
jgi:hypothetical protein